MKKAILTILIIIALAGFAGAYFWFYVPFSDSGVKAGILNNFKHKGVIFKTYEGELIQSGFRPGQQGLMSNEFQFSVEDPEVAKQLMSLSGKNLQLHYKEYYGKLPWRGYSKYIVDSIVNISSEPHNDLDPNLPPITE